MKQEKIKIKGKKAIVNVPDSLYEEKSSLFSKLSWKIYMFKLHLELSKLEREHFKARKKYCRKGFHKLISQKYSSKKGNEKWNHCHYLKCVHCNYMFFATLKQKELYLKLNGKDKDSFSAFFNVASSLKAKHPNRVGATKKGDVSSSSQKVKV